MAQLYDALVLHIIYISVKGYIELLGNDYKVIG